VTKEVEQALSRAGVGLSRRFIAVVIVDAYDAWNTARSLVARTFVVNTYPMNKQRCTQMSGLTPAGDFERSSCIPMACRMRQNRGLRRIRANNQ